MSESSKIRFTYYLVGALFSFSLSLTGPVWMLRLTGAGFDLRVVSLFAAVLSLTVLTMEIPTGVIADRYGRRLSVLLSFALGTAGALLWALSPSIPVMLVGSILTGTAQALYSGAFAAWAVDALARTGAPVDTTALFGRGRGISHTIAVVGGLVSGSLLVRWGLHLPYLGSAMINLLMFALAARLMTERWSRPAARSMLAEWRTMGESLRTVGRLAVRNPALGWLLLAPIPVFIGGAAPVSQWQVRFQELAPDLQGVTGLVWAFMLAVSATASFAVPRLVRATGSPLRFLTAATIVNSLGIAGAVLSGALWAAIPFFCLHVAATTAGHIVGTAAVSDQVPSEVRATALSVFSMIDALADVAGVTLFGFLSTSLTLQVSWSAAALLVLLSAPLMMIAAGKPSMKEASQAA